MTASSPSDRDRAALDPDVDGKDGTGPSAASPGRPGVCPFLAGGDGSWRSAEPTRSHVCAAVQPPAMLAAAKQRQLCLGAGHADCATFRAARELLTTPVHGPFEAGLWPVASPRVTSFEPVRSGLAGGLTTPQAKAGGQALLIGLIVVAFVVLVIARTTPAAGPGSGVTSPVPSLTAGGGATGSPAPRPTAAPSPASETPRASTGPMASPSAGASSAADRTYTVKRGDTLSGIALKFGVTVKALRKANGLAKEDVIRRGQVLVIPAPAATPAP